jgi:hypothetical protein
MDESFRKFELISPGPIQEGEELTVAYKWVGSGEAAWFQIYVTPVGSGSCVDGPLLYSYYLEGEPWQVNYNESPWHAGGGSDDLQTFVTPPQLPGKFRLCIATWGGGERVWEEFFFEWLP